MNHGLHTHHGRWSLPLLIAASASLWALPASAALTDIANAPLASASNLSVKPNLMFILDASGSMNFDAMPDYAEPQQGASERKYWDQVYNCKKRLGDGITGYTHCDRIDPPLGAAEFNGMYYNPDLRYQRPVNSDGTALVNKPSNANPINASAVPCDPYTGKKCSDYYYLDGFDGYYSSGANTTASPGSTSQVYGNSLVKQWYGTSTTFDITTKFPEIVYCISGATTSDVNDTNKCRRNGLSNATDPIQTGNPFRYASYGFRTGYPEVIPVNEFWRPSGTGTTVTVTTSSPIGLTCGTYPCTPTAISASGNYAGLSTPFKIIPRTGTGTSGAGFDVCTGNTCATTVDIVQLTAANQFTYSISSRTGQNLSANGRFDLLTAYKTGTVSGSGTSKTTTVYVTAPNHGLVAGDKINVYLSNTAIICTSGATFTVLASPAPSTSTFAFTSTGCSSIAATTSATGFFQRTTFFNVPVLRQSNPFYYSIEPTEHCSDDAFTTCTAATSPTGAFVNPAPVRFCLTEFDANRADTPTGKERSNTLARCQKKYRLFSAAVTGAGYSYAGYVYPRYGNFRRFDIVTGQTYTRTSTRLDCASASGCTYTEELNNFANWFAYYRNRLLMMKSSTGLAFLPIDNRYRVGFITIDPGSPVSSSKYLKIDDFGTSQKSSWYSKLYNMPADTGTPLPKALARVGRYFGGKHDGINNGMDDDPVQYSCQQNFALLTTDGFWSERSGKSLTDTSTNDTDSIGNRDNTFNCSSTDPHTVCRPVWDGYATTFTSSDFSTAGTVADVAQYYYNTDLRTGTATSSTGQDIATDNVPSSTKDPATWQHMTTFGLGMAEGVMNWTKDYATASSGDYHSVDAGLTGCSWDPQCRWPVPGYNRRQENLDDLWHAAVNGRGAFFYARDTKAVQDGLQTALTNLQLRESSGAAAATSTSSITPTDRGIFQSVYTTIQWSGDIIAQLINPNTGVVESAISWKAADQLKGLVAATSDTRTMYTFNSGSTTGLKNFLYAQLTTTEKAWFDNKCSPLSTMSQCALLETTVELPAANSGTNMVNFLRGQTQYEGTLYRDRLAPLGDTVNSVPLYIGKPRWQFIDNVTPTYLDWAATSTIKGRTPALYAGANDGMLHAFNANTGVEMWAYIPRMIMPDLWKLAEANYATKHVFYVDGSPSSMDVYDGSTWRTILVGGLNSGGRGFYALDVTVPGAPKGLWEFCSDSTLCAISDSDLGLSYGNPIITKRKSDGRWVVLVTSGYNNVSPGTGKGFLYVLDALTGVVLSKVATGAGSTTSPSGLAKINAWYDSFGTDNTAKAVYGTDLQGNIWEFDMNGSITVKKIAQALDASNKVQPITTKPELGLIDSVHKVLYVGTGRYLGNLDLSDPATQTPAGTDSYQQSFYAFKISPDDDSDFVSGSLRGSANGLVRQTITELSGGQTRTTSTSTVNWATSNGWYMDFNPGGASPGERVSIDPQLILGTLIITTGVPGATCSVGGDGWLYQVDYRTGQYVSSAPGHIAAKKTQGAMIVGVSVYQLGSGSIVANIRDSSAHGKDAPVYTTPAENKAKRAGWREISPHR